MENMDGGGQKVVDLLTKLKNPNNNERYPSDRLAARRRSYLRQMGNVGLGIGIGAGINSIKGGGNGAAFTTTISSKVLEVALITAIAIEAGTAAYLYSDKIANALRHYFSSPTVQDVSSSSSNGDSSTSPVSSEFVVTPLGTASEIPSGTPLVTASEMPTGMPSVTASETPLENSSVTASETPSTPPSTFPPATPVYEGDNQNTDSGNETNTNVNVTPNPNENNGNHYGQTPKPEQTKENNGGGDDNNNDGGGSNNNGEGEGDNNGGEGGNNNNGGDNKKP